MTMESRTLKINPHRMVKTKKAIIYRRAPQEYGSSNSTETGSAVQETTNSDTTVVNKTPTATIALAVALALLALVLLIVGGIWFHRRQQKNTNKRKAPSIAFDSNAFNEKKGALKLDQPLTADLTNHLPFALQSGGPRLYRPSTASSTDSDTTVGWMAPNSASTFRVTNNDDNAETRTLDESISYSSPTLPKAAAEKHKLSHIKPNLAQAIVMRPDDPATAISPPPSYAMANWSEEFLVPLPPMLPPQKGRQTPTPPTPPANRKSFAPSAEKETNKGKEREEQGPAQYLTVYQGELMVVSPVRSESFAPKGLVITPPPATWPSTPYGSIPDSAWTMGSSTQSHGGLVEPIPVVSPARSESFAPKDLLIPSPAASPSTFYGSTPNSASGGGSSSQSQLGSASLGSFGGAQSPRLMNVVAPYIPTLPDELRVKTGDTVRVIQIYNDGWCFAHFVGKVDAPKGVLPLVCLQDRQRILPLGKKSSNSSVTSTSWR